MRRLIAGAKKALHRNKSQNSKILQNTQSQNEQFLIDLSISEPSVDGYICWDNHQCCLCSRFLEPWFVLDMFTSKFVQLGTMYDLLVWSQTGGRCSLCIHICSRFFEETRGEVQLDASVIVRWDTRDTAVKNGRRDEIPSFDFELSWGFPHIKARSARMQCYTNEDQKMGHYMTTRPANPDVSSPAAFTKAKTWLAECVDGHTKCKQLGPETSEMPSRVLEITMRENSEYSIRLYESTGQKSAYVALSYIWGKPQTFRLLKSNIDEHRRQVNTKDLPRTIMDAVRCTQQLGLKYLWVDSLCIIQDSLEDKAEQIGRMSNIYKNAHVTISAAKAKNCDEGFLESRPMAENLKKLSFKLDILTPKDPIALNEWINRYRAREDFSNYLPRDGIKEAFETSKWSTPEAWYDEASTIWLVGSPLGDEEHVSPLTAPEIEKEPISKRGWTLQESWLSPRMLIYGSAQLLWKCNSAGVQVDGGDADSASKWNVMNSYQTDGHGNMINEDGNKIDDSHKKWIFETVWEDLVQESSRRELTVPGDKLNALEGIVQELRRQTGGEFLAGLWRQSLVTQLAWYQDATPLDSSSLLWSPQRTCPSWSWIKTDGPVHFSHAENSGVVVEDAIITRNEMTGNHPDTRLVVEGSITLRAPVSTLPIEQSLPTFKFLDSNSSKQAFTNVIYLDGGLTNPEFVVETVNGSSSQILAPEAMRFLELSWGKLSGAQNVANESRGLVLVPVAGQPDTYRRVGFFVVALEYDVDEVNSGYNLVTLLSLEPRNVRPTDFGELWKASFKEEVVTIL